MRTPSACAHTSAARAQLVVHARPRRAAVFELGARVRSQREHVLQFNGAVAKHAEERHEPVVEVVVDLEPRAGLGEQHGGASAERLDVGVVARQKGGDPR
jgi:hypothetical protein